MTGPAARTPEYDGRLQSWAEVLSKRHWDALLVGNGLSINVWGDFAYRSLFEEAKHRNLFAAADAALFEKFDTENFEDVLGALSTVRVGDALGEPRKAELKLHASVQGALAKAVQNVHVLRPDIPDEKLEAIASQLRFYRFVFTTSYDLLLYWAVANAGYAGFVDFFWAQGHNAFEESTIWLPASAERTRLHFLHGALHLVVHPDGMTCKRTADWRSILEQFGEPHLGERAAHPLVITEARAADKARRISDNAYLSYCWKQLQESDAPLVIFGHSLSHQDSHLVDALNEGPDRPIAVGLQSRRRQQDNKKEQHRISSRLEAPDLFSSTQRPIPSGGRG